MTRTNKFVLSVVLFLSALALSACASKPKETPVAEPAPVAQVAEQVTAPEPAPVVAPEPAPAPVSEVAEQQAPAPVEIAEQPVPKPVVKKAKKKAAKIKIVPKVAEPEPVVQPKPVAAPAPIAVPEPVVQQEKPTPPPVIVEPVKKVAEPGFLEKYWLWMLGLVIGVIAVLLVVKKKE